MKLLKLISPTPSTLPRSDEAPSSSERAEFAGFYREHERMIRGTLFHLVPPADLDDLVQSAFVRAWENRRQFRGQASAGSWIARIAIHLAQDLHRHRRARPEDSTEDEALARAIHESGADFAREASLENKQWVARALATLSAEGREVVVLRFFQDLELDEIAFATGQPLGTVKSRLHHAKTKLKKIFDLEIAEHSSAETETEEQDHE